MISQQLQSVRESICEYEKKYHRSLAAVTLLAVSKAQPTEKIRSAYAAGQHAFGENYLQEALAKMTLLQDLAIEWHFIGPLQSNKLKKIATHFQWVHSVSSIEHAKKLNAHRPLEFPPLNICFQVNSQLEGSKAGIPPDSASILTLAQACAVLPRLRLRGLMFIPAPQKTFAAQRQTFHQCAALANVLQENGFMTDVLSMGMSDDMEAAIAEGSTLVRIGTKIFGER